VDVTAQETLSLKWLKKAQAAVNADPSFRKRGSIDVNMAIKVDKSTFLVTFSGFTCHNAQKMNDAELRDADFIIEMSADLWDRFLEGRRAGDGRTLAEIDTTDDIVKAINPRKKLDFLRYHTSLQAFFDAGVRTDAPQAA
jgi:hypothetical protein